MLKNGEFCLVSNKKGDMIEVKKFVNKIPAFTYPSDSTLLDIYIVSDEKEKMFIGINDIDKKCFIIMSFQVEENHYSSSTMKQTSL